MKAAKKRLKILFQWLFLTVSVGLLFQLPTLKNLDASYNDYWRYQIAEKNLPSDNILIIEIDDKSLTELEPKIGRWPWPRSIHAFLIEGLNLAQAKVIVFDILFSEKDLYQPDSDAFFSDSVSQNENVFLSAALLSRNSLAQPIAFSSLPDSLIAYAAVDKSISSNININLPWVVESKNWNVGLIDFFADEDGVARRYPLIVERDGWGLFSLPQRVFNYLQIKNNKKLTPAITNVVHLNYKGINEVPFNSISYVDAKSLLDNQQQLELFRDKLVIIGPTATGLHDLRATPIFQRYPATSILATAIDNLINDDFLRLTNRNYGLCLLIFLVSLLWILTQIINGYKNQLLAISGFLLLCSFVFYFLCERLSYSGVLFPAASILSLLLLSAIMVVFYRGLKEYISRQHIQKTFSRFMDPEVVKQLTSEDDWQDKIANKSTQVSVLFSDIRSFTTMSETRSAEQIITILNDYFNLQVEAIFETKGTLDKFIGDAVMAFWGAPLEDKHHAVHAVNAALLMVENLLKFRESLPDDLKDFDIGIGIHSGEAVVGMLGCDKRFDYTAIGDTVNLASRIEGVTKGVARVLVSEATKQLCGNQFEFNFCGEFAVKGRNEKVKLYQPEMHQSEK